MEASNLDFNEFIIRFSKSDDQQTTIPSRQRTQLSVLLQKRFRGETLGDRIGTFNLATNNWVEPEIAELVPFNIFTENIVKPKVQTKAAVCAQAAIAVECKPRQEENTQANKNAIICQKISDWADDRLWTPALTTQSHELVQLTHGCFFKSFWNPQKKGESYEEEMWDTDVIEMEGVDSPEMEMAESPMMEFDVAKSQTRYAAGDNDIQLIPSMAFRVDERYSQGAHLDRCRWVIQLDLMSRFEIEMEFKIKTLNRPSIWSYSTQWLYTLQTGISFPFKSQQQGDKAIRELDLFEVKRIFFSSEFLHAFTNGNAKYEFKNDEGEVLFALGPGENAGEVVRRMAAEEAKQRGSAVQKDGLCVAVCGEQVIGYYLANFKDQLDYDYFLSDPYSFWSLPCSELETHQHVVNTLLTSICNQVMSNKNKLAVNRQALEDEDVDGDSDIINFNDGPIKDMFEVIPGVPVTQDQWMMYHQAKQNAEEVSLVSPAMMGQPSNNKTFGQERLQRDMAVGTLTPRMQSHAQTKVGVMRKQCLLVQMYWHPKRLAKVCGMSDGVLTWEDIEKFYQSDIDNDVIFSYLSGSEMPKTQGERQTDLAEYTSFLIQLAQVVPQAGLVTPEIAYDLLRQMAQYKGFPNIDPQNAELDREAAERRFEFIKEGLERNLQLQLQIEQPQNMLIQNVIAMTMNNPILIPLPEENHAVQIEFYRDKMLLEYRSEEPNLIMVGCCQQMITRHREAQVMFGQQKVSDAMAVQQPMMQMQQAEQDKAMQAEAQQNEQNNLLEAAKLESENQRTQEDREHEIGMKVLDLAAQKEQGEASKK